VITGPKWSPGKRAGPLSGGGAIAGANWAELFGVDREGLALEGATLLNSSAPRDSSRGAFSGTLVPSGTLVASAGDCTATASRTPTPALTSKGRRAGPLPGGGVTAGANRGGLVLVGAMPLDWATPRGNPEGRFPATFVPGDAPAAGVGAARTAASLNSSFAVSAKSGVSLVLR